MLIYMWDWQNICFYKKGAAPCCGTAPNYNTYLNWLLFFNGIFFCRIRGRFFCGINYFLWGDDCFAGIYFRILRVFILISTWRTRWNRKHSCCREYPDFKWSFHNLTFKVLLWYSKLCKGNPAKKYKKRQPENGLPLMIEQN